jgi:SAM-dependent methyltransferase
LDPPDVTRARVLEISCAAAANLIPFAATHPLARTVGIDLSQVHIDQGRRRVRALGLDNVELMHGDVAHLDLAAAGQFDFIICHGVYSWVPHEVQNVILAACGKLLSPSGVAYVGYNTYPGWKAKEIVRDAMLLSAGDSATIDEKVRRARSMVDFLQKVAQPNRVLAKALNDYQLMVGPPSTPRAAPRLPPSGGHRDSGMNGPAGRMSPCPVPAGPLRPSTRSRPPIG